MSESQLKVDRDKLKSQLGEAKTYLQQLEKEKAAKEKQVADANAKIQQLEKDKADRDAKLGPAGAKIAQLEKEKAEKDKQIAALTASDKKEREAKEALQKEKPERDRQLGEAKARIAQLEKDKADRDKQIASLSASDKKEREAREKLEKTMADVAARERERHSKEIEDQKEREKLVEGGELPGHIREPVTCDLPDEVPAGEDLYVHCVPQPGVGAKMLAFYYRSAGMGALQRRDAGALAQGLVRHDDSGRPRLGKADSLLRRGARRQREGRRQQRQGHLAQRHHHPRGRPHQGPRPEVTFVGRGGEGEGVAAAIQ